MVGFGFMDNIIMIQAGDFIDSTFGVVLGLSTLTAAAMGNVVSDTSGTLFGGIVESATDRMRLTRPKLTDAQRSLRITKLCGTGGAAVGVIIGCLVGASSLFFMDLEKADRLKKLQELATVSRAVLTKAHALLEAERCSLYFYDQEKRELWTRTTTNNILISLPLDNVSLACHTARSRALVNVADAYESEHFDSSKDRKYGLRTKEVLCAPIISEEGSLLGVIQVINKREAGGFTREDEKLVQARPPRHPPPCALAAAPRPPQMLAAHIAIFVATVGGEEATSEDFGPA